VQGGIPRKIRIERDSQPLKQPTPRTAPSPPEGKGKEGTCGKKSNKIKNLETGGILFQKLGGGSWNTLLGDGRGEKKVEEKRRVARKWRRVHHLL